eukprot:COSAG04_NODE_27568_length_281_cov_1.945055_2_plen_20_part_01
MRKQRDIGFRTAMGYQDRLS